MSLSKSSPNSTPESTPEATPEETTHETTPTEAASSDLPDYAGLVSFLLKPSLEEAADSLKVHREVSSSGERVWLRVAFEGADKGRVFGRGGRNIQAIRTALEAAGKAAGQVVYLDVYGDRPEREESGGRSRSNGRSSSRESSSRPKPPPKPRPRLT